MWTMLWPVLTVVAANTLYHLCAKSTPETLDTFASLTLTYAVAALCSLVMFHLTRGKTSLFTALREANWASWVLGLSIVGLEFGYLWVYRVGWKVSVGNLVTGISLACVLLVVGVLLYKETPSVRQLVGMGVCLLGLILIAGN